MRVLVTAAGSGPGVAIVKAVRDSAGFDSFVLAVDMSSRAAGLYLAHERAIVPGAGDPGYPGRLLELSRQHGIEMIIPIFDTETPVLARERERFENAGIHVAVNPLDCVLRANDKMESFRLCEAAGIPQPGRFPHPGDAAAGSYPIVGKPLQGVGGKGMLRLDGPGELPTRLDPAAFIWQEWVEGQEFSIDTFGDPDSATFVAVPRLRRIVKAGQMVDGETLADPELIEFARTTCRAFGAQDVCCVQVIRNRAGRLAFVEINPRYGTGVSLSIHAGIDFPRLQWLSAFAPETITRDMLRFRSGAGVIRYWEEIYT
ncbi:MAG TPA: ATP-grasp domain-containing protein [Thermoanaerobaculia bacterium]|nr:ATP-grasp domain-containing protein [Thermoanaerobaculia bacterium]